MQVIDSYGGQGRNRTADASLFRAALYQLSYLATSNRLQDSKLKRTVRNIRKVIARAIMMSGTTQL
jgi:hypothetical protein